MNKLSTITFIFLAACSAFTGEELGRLALNELSTNQNVVSQETTVDLQARDEIVFWSEMDMEYEGEVELRFRVNISKDDEPYENLEVNPIVKDLTLGETKTTVNDKTSWSFSGQNLIFNVQEDGKYTFKAILIASENSSLVIKKAELVLKRI